jgi:hypothetical protein
MRSPRCPKTSITYPGPSSAVQHFMLVLSNLNVVAPRLFLNKNALDASTLRAEWSTEFCDLSAVIAGVEYPDNRADF